MFAELQAIVCRISIIGCCMAVTLPCTGAGDDFVIPVTGGWVADGDCPHDASPTANAVVVFQEENNRIVRSMVIQANLDGTRQTTVFEGKAYWIRYAPDGSSLLVHLSHEESLGRRDTQKYLLDTEGRILWSRIDNRSYRYSSTGEVIWAWAVYSIGGGAGGEELEIFDLSGESLKSVSKDPAPWDAVVLGAGDRVLLSTDTTLLSLDTSGGPPKTEWTFVKPEGFGRFFRMRLLDEKHLLWEVSLGKSAIIDVTDGRLVYVYDPVALASSDPRVPDDQYFRYEMSRGPAPGTILLFDGSAEARILNLASGKMVSKSMDVSLPGPEFELGFRWLPQQRLFLFSPNDVHVRPMY